ncbi:hypothetical protein [Thermococcus onnurineus]|uniref:hypothetical protein n=1 Tax=Thermococcus onnurineus TaxID=342948 RepID=UPI0003EA1EDC|nr:hypothetical protein [Thermococcus onnurineus]
MLRTVQFYIPEGSNLTPLNRSIMIAIVIAYLEIDEFVEFVKTHTLHWYMWKTAKVPDELLNRFKSDVEERVGKKFTKADIVTYALQFVLSKYPNFMNIVSLTSSRQSK